jgi:hypothetical protein
MTKQAKFFSIARRQITNHFRYNIEGETCLTLGLGGKSNFIFIFLLFGEITLDNPSFGVTLQFSQEGVQFEVYITLKL